MRDELIAIRTLWYYGGGGAIEGLSGSHFPAIRPRGAVVPKTITRDILDSCQKGRRNVETVKPRTHLFW